MTTKEFSDIVSKHQRLVLTICNQFVKDMSIAEDLTQETFISAYLHIDSCPPTAVKPWLARIATNKAKDYLKSAYNRKMVATENPSDEVSATNLLYLNPKPEDIYISREGVNRIREEIYALKEPYSKVCELFFIQEYTIDEIAAELKRPASTVYTQLNRAKNILKRSVSSGDI